jgi:MerR family transcriptional regulator, repressor of the yfmOP operon
MTPAATEERSLRIGEVAKRADTTTRTVRYYEEIGLLPGSAERTQGEHRAFTEADVVRLKEILRFRDLLGLSLEQLKDLVEAEDARALLRAEFRRTEDSATRRRILDEALGHIERQLDLVRARKAELEGLEEELVSKRRRVRARQRELRDS